MNYRSTASFGKREEYRVIAELLLREFDVYTTLIDDQGIDCVIRLSNKKYLDIQIKARSKDVKQWNLFPGMTLEDRDNYFFIFYTEKDDSFWVLPSEDVKRLAYKNKPGKKHAGKISLRVKGSEFEKYKNEKGFALLEVLRKDAKNESERAK